MVFSDLFFIYVFIPLFLILYFFNKKLPVKNTIIIIFSLIFYSWGACAFVPLILISSLVDYFLGLFIERQNGKKTAVIGVVISLVVNLGILMTFKYSGFIVTNINDIFNISIPVPNITLPIGISFYTFQTITYIIDVYKGRTKAQHNYFYYLMYLAMFFQLVAGPIVRYDTIAKEITERETSVADFSNGLNRFVFGLGKKILIANTLGSLVYLNIGQTPVPSSVFSAWFGIIMFSLQIYFDFSGYSDMAIGLGLMCGFHFNENFNYPYISKSASEFWRRWHISLGSFFRDYVYIPMGGNKKHQILNLAVVWFLTGLWHGASWNFVLWGLYFGVIIILEKLFLGKILEKIPSFFSHLYSIFIFVIGWTLFYFTDIKTFATYIKSMFGANNIPLIDEVSKSHLMNNLFIIIIAIILCTPVYKVISQKLDSIEHNNNAIIIARQSAGTILTVALLILSSVMLVGETFNPFLYFRF